QDLPPTSFLLWDREYWIPALYERVRDLGYNFVFQLLLDNLGQALVCFLVSFERGLMFQDFKIVRTVLDSPDKHYTSQYSIAPIYRSPQRQEAQQSGAHFVLDLSLNRTSFHRQLRYNNCQSIATRNQLDLGVYCQRSPQQVVIFFWYFIFLHVALSIILLSFFSFH
ncbi:MAG: hypothetical protein EZS28_043648, partial [Streblomastix strix]